MTRRSSSPFFVVSLALGLASCAIDTDPDDQSLAAAAQMVDAAVAPLDAGIPADDAAVAPFVLSSSVVKDGEYIDPKYRCRSPSPELSWTAGPAGTQSYALVFRDLSNGFFHWTMWDIPASARGLPAGVPNTETVATPAGAKQGPNWSRRTLGYGGPCGGDNPYEFTLYALDVGSLPEVTSKNAGEQVLTAIEAHDLASTKLKIRSVDPARARSAR